MFGTENALLEHVSRTTFEKQNLHTYIQKALTTRPHSLGNASTTRQAKRLGQKKLSPPDPGSPVPKIRKTFFAV